MKTVSRAERNRLVELRANKYFSRLKPRCDKGGCSNHSGHEYCSVDAAWERAKRNADDDYYDLEVVE